MARTPLRLTGHALSVTRWGRPTGDCSCGGWASIDCENQREVRSLYRDHLRQEIVKRKRATPPALRDKPRFEVYIEGDPDQDARAWFVDRSDAEFFIGHLSPERIGTEFEWKIRSVKKEN